MHAEKRLADVTPQTRIARVAMPLMTGSPIVHFVVLAWCVQERACMGLTPSLGHGKHETVPRLPRFDLPFTFTIIH